MYTKNITRFTYATTDFQGWRVSVQRHGNLITKYFSDLKHGSEEAAFEKAKEYLDKVLNILNDNVLTLPERVERARMIS